VIRVLLADDQSLVRAGFRALLDAQPDIEVAAEAADGEEAVRRIRELRPDVVLMDIRMPALDGLAATRRVTEDPDLKDVKVVMLTTFELDEYVFEAIRSGASGFLVKDTEPAELLRAVRAVVAGDALLSPGVTRRLIAEFAARSKEPAAADALAGLTEREREVMALVGIGLSNEEIARRLVVSAHREDPRQPHHGEARRPRPGPTGRARLRVGAGAAGLAGLSPRPEPEQHTDDPGDEEHGREHEPGAQQQGLQRVRKLEEQRGTGHRPENDRRREGRTAQRVPDLDGDRVPFGLSAPSPVTRHTASQTGGRPVGKRPAGRTREVFPSGVRASSPTWGQRRLRRTRVCRGRTPCSE
jgi:DNA-binding NarL/FixJ family response regulator